MSMDCLKALTLDTYEECRSTLERLIHSKSFTSTLCASPDGVYFTVVSGKDTGVFIVADVEDFKDSFNKIEIETGDFSINGNTTRGVLIHTKMVTEGEISVIESLFDDLLRSIRPDTLFDIGVWFEDWKEAIGNVHREKKIYDVLGEMIVLSMLMSEGLEPSWMGPSSGRHDITCETIECEVKSTIKRQMKPQIKVSSGRQLDVTPGKTLYLYVCTFEEDDNGNLSIDIVEKQLIDQGFSQSILHSSLERLGMNSSINRRKKYKLVESIRKYEVNDSFPRLTNESFVGGQLPKGILNLSYSILLDDIIYEELNLDM